LKKNKYRKINIAKNIATVKNVLPKICHKFDLQTLAKFFVKHLATLWYSGRCAATSVERR